MVLTFNQYHSLWSQSVQVQSTVKCALLNYTSGIKRETVLFVQDENCFQHSIIPYVTFRRMTDSDNRSDKHPLFSFYLLYHFLVLGFLCFKLIFQFAHTVPNKYE